MSHYLSQPKGKGMTYRGGSVTKIKSVAKILQERQNRRKKKYDRIAKQAQKSMSRPASEWPDMGPSRGSKLFGTGFGYGIEDVIKFLDKKDLPAVSATSLGARKGASKVIIERGYRYVIIKDKDDKRMDGKTGFLIENDTEKYPTLFKYIITLDKPVGNMFVYYTNDKSKFKDVPRSTKDSAHTTRINKQAMEKALKRQEDMCKHDKDTCLQKVLKFFRLSKFKSHKKSVKKSHKKSVKKSVKKSHKKSVKKSHKKSVKKSHKNNVKKNAKKI
jgi:hypothetical protein